MRNYKVNLWVELSTIAITIVFTTLWLTGCGNNIGTGSASNGNTDEDNSILIVNGGSSTGNLSGCEGVLTVDGEGGLLYKPESESDGKPVILFPAEYKTTFLSVEAVTLDGDFVQGVFSGFGNPNRQTWRFDVSASELSGVFEVQGTENNCQVRIPDPTVRQD